MGVSSELEFCEDSTLDCLNSHLTAILLGGTGATGREVLKELNANNRVSKIVFITRRPIEIPDMPKVKHYILLFNKWCLINFEMMVLV